MPRVVLVHWGDPLAESRAEALRAAGFAVESLSPDDGKSLAPLLALPPAAIVIDLDRRPSQGLAVGTFLRQRAATRRVPLVLAGGTEEKTAKIRSLLPDAPVAAWPSLATTVRETLAAPPPAAPSVPGTMAGYSGTPLPKKLGVAASTTVLLLGAPKGFEATLGAVPGGARVTRRAGRGDVVVLFVSSRTELDARFPSALAALAPKGRLWIAWPKKGSGVATDVSQTVVRAHGLDRGVVDWKICAIDATWSGLCFARRSAKG